MNLVKSKPLLLLALLFFPVLLGGCAFDPLKMYSGPDLPKSRLSLIRQIDFLESRPVYLLNPPLTGQAELRVDDLGMVVLPGTYSFKSYLYRYRYQPSARIVDMTVRPGEATFPVAQPVWRKVREEKPYKQTEDVQLTFKSGFQYGLWCSEDAKIEIKILGPYP